MERILGRDMLINRSLWRSYEFDAADHGYVQVRPELPVIVAASVLLTIDYAGAETTGCNAPRVSGLLPEHLCHFGGVAWHDTWTSDGSGILMTPVAGAEVRFESPPGFHELRHAIGLLADELRLKVRQMLLLAHPSMEFGIVVEDDLVAPLLREFGGRFGVLVAEVWYDLREAARTAHGRVALAAERRGLL